MEIGLITDGLGRLPLPEVLDIVAAAGLSCVGVATGNWVDGAARRPPGADRLGHSV